MPHIYRGVIHSQQRAAQNGARGGYKKGSMDGTRRPSAGLLGGTVRGSAMGFYSESFRFEGGGRHVIGLKRSGKSCRLRWVNYLHPDLKRGKMTPHEEKLILELHSQFGNRWSKIARRLPGRTDNEIKNYWRTHMRKKAQQEKKTGISASSPSSNCTSLSSLSSSLVNPGSSTIGSPDDAFSVQENEKAHQEAYSMDDIWKDITSSEEPIKPVWEETSSHFSCPSLASPFWEYCPDTLWKMEVDEDSKAFFFNQ